MGQCCTAGTAVAAQASAGGTAPTVDACAAGAAAPSRKAAVGAAPPWPAPPRPAPPVVVREAKPEAAGAGSREGPRNGAGRYVSWRAEVQATICEAQRILKAEDRVLDAEACLGQLLARLEAPGAGDEAAAAALELRSSPVFAKVLARVQKYEKIGRLLDTTGFQLQWKREDAALWVNAPHGATWFEYRVAATLDGSLSEIMVALNEFDLAPRYQPLLAGAPAILGEHTRNQFVMDSVINLMMLRIEVIVEISRFVDTKLGFLAEHVRPPPEGTPLPRKPWQTKRISLSGRNFFLPRGGGQRGTVVVSVTRAEVGMCIPDYILRFVVNKMAKDFLDNLHTCVRLAKTPGSPWHERLIEDGAGTYKELQRAEEAAAARQEFSVNDLPGGEIFDRPWRITQEAQEVGVLKAESEVMFKAADVDCGSSQVISV